MDSKEQSKPDNKDKQSSSSQTSQKPIPSSQKSKTGSLVVRINKQDTTVSPVRQ